MGTRTAFTASMALALLMLIGGLTQIVSASGSALFGMVLILAALGLSSYAKNARAAYLHRRKMTDMWNWAQGLGPRGRPRP